MTDINSTNPLGSFARSALTAVTRHAMQVITGLLLSNGLIADTQSEQIISGGSAVLVFIAGLGWSLYQKKVAHKAIDTAQAK